MTDAIENLNENKVNENSFPAHQVPVRDPVDQADSSQVAALLGIVFSGVTMLLPVYALSMGGAGENVDAPPLYRSLFFIAPFFAFALVALIGSIAFLKKQNIHLVRAGAICMLVPVLGPCFGLTFPLGIWFLMLLNRNEVLQSFRDTELNRREQLNAADDFLAMAAKLDRNGEWETALDMYFDAAKRWPEQKSYINNCIATIKDKISTREK